MSAVVVLWCVAAFIAVAVIAIVAARAALGSALVYGLNGLVALAALGAAGWHLAMEPAAVLVALPLGLPGIGAHIRIDALSAFFLIVVNLGAAVVCLYGIGYGRHEKSPLRVVPFIPLYLVGMNLVVVADDAFTFLIAWEFMSLTSWALVMAHHRDPANARAGATYLIMASFGTLTLLLAFGLLAGAEGGYAFDVIRANHPAPPTAALVLLLALAGAGSKAGLVPLHVWLPLAHPAAPSHVSALMSGVMTKVAIYGFIRIVFDLLGEPAWWSGLIVLALAGLTAVIGVLHALMQHDIKRLLAYSTVENVGIIFLGLGLALAFRANGMNSLAALAMTAALLHVLNHALFKSLLFLGAGAVLTGTGERNMERLGGLIHRMPHTAIAFLVGCVAISALPPLNGFVSEWLTFQAILSSPALPQWGGRFMVPAAGAMLALSAALAAACFVKAYGVTFLGRARTPAAESAVEVDRFSRAAMFILAALCFAAGVLPGPIIDQLAPVVQGLTGGRMPPQTALLSTSIVPIAESRSSYNAAILLIFMVLSATLIALAIHRFATRATRRGPIWDCGYPDPSVATQYSSSSVAMPIRRVFGASVFGLREKVDMPRPGETRAAHFQVRVFDPAWRFIYGPAMRTTLRAAIWLNQMQFQTVRWYLTLVFVTLIALLILVAAWR
jgi:formate hydrogenlyase subunit 3/multisubunit Na+/H+ antiporter MnhD subunit